MRIKSNLDYDLTLEFYSLRGDKGYPEFTDSFFLLPKEEIDISVEELDNSNYIVLFHSYKGINIRLLEKGAAVFRPENSSARELISTFLPADAHEPIVSNLKTDTNLWMNPPLCVISEKTRY